MPAGRIVFPPFALDLDAGLLLRGDEGIHLRPRTWEVLRHLALRPGVLVTKDDLLAAVWDDAVVTEGTLTNSIRELRSAFGDDARAPRFIETVHRRGFRFVARVEEGANQGAASRHVVATPERLAGPPAQPSASRTPRPAGPVVVGRSVEAEALMAIAADAAAGSTRVVLVSGEAGIGKSTLVEHFLAALPGADTPVAFCVAVGRTVGYLQGAPPYLPLLSALEDLVSRGAGVAVQGALERHAPDVLGQMPWLLPPGAVLPDATMHRGLASRLVDLLAQLSAPAPLALVLEDIHDADAPTVELLAGLLDIAPSLRLLVVATYRPGEAVLSGNGLVTAAATIAGHRGGRTIDLELLDEAEVAHWLRSRDASFWNAGRVRQVHRQSGGNPLFMVTMADTAEIDGRGIDGAVPEGLRGLLDAQLRTLDFRQRELLMTASVAGVEFSSLAVSAASGVGIDDVEQTFDALAAHGRFVRSTGLVDWPSGSVGQGYAFRHQLYRSALQDALPAARRRVLHQRIGEALEKGHAGATLEVAAELADHFARSGDRDRAVAYLREAAGLARARFAHREALDLLGRALALLDETDTGAQRDQVELGLQMDRAASAGALHGHGSMLAKETSARVEELGSRLAPGPERFRSMLVAFGYRIIRSDCDAATRLAAQMMEMAKGMDWPVALLGATSATAMAASARGDFALAGRNFRIVLDGVPPEFRLPSFRDVLVPSQAVMAQTLCYLGLRDESDAIGAAALERSDWLGDQFERASARISAAYCAALRLDRDAARRWAAQAADISASHGVEETASIAAILLAWASVGDDLGARRRDARAAIDGLDRTGHLLGKAFFLGLLADLEREAGDLASAGATLAEARAFCEATGSRRHLAELLRVTAAVERDCGRPWEGWHERSLRLAQEQGCRLVLERLDAGAA